MFFFVVAPFCSCPASLVFRIFFAVGPGCAKCFFFCCAPLGAATFRRGQSKKKKTPRVLFFSFFCSGPVPAPNGASPSPAFPRGPEQKKTTHPGWCFFLLWPRAGAQRGFSFPCLSPGPQQKNTLGGVFFLLWPRAGTGLLLPLPFPGAGAKKQTPWVVFSFLLRPRADAHSLTAGLAWVAMAPPRRGGFFFFCCGPARTGVVFFFAVAPPGHSLTHCGLGRFRQGPGGVFFFLLRPRRVVLDNNKKCLGYYIGSKKTRRGHSKKKNTTSTPKPLNP